MTIMPERKPLDACLSDEKLQIVSVRPKPTPAELDQQQGWRAQLELGFSARFGKTLLKHRRQYGPLAVQRPLYPEGGICHTYLLHPPGGVVGGDKLSIEVSCGPGASALVTTPGATKFYRSAGAFACQKQSLTVKKGAMLEWLPQENIYFPEARVRMDTEIHVEAGGRFIGWELHCFGRPALKEGFSTGSVVGSTCLRIEDNLILAEQLNVHGDDPHQYSAGMRGNAMLATMMITDSDVFLLNMVQGLLNHYQNYLTKNRIVSGVTEVADINDKHRVLVIRVMGNGTEPIMTLFREVWTSVREYWHGTSPNLPRIWAT
ncbi:Urease accessory protein UreD [Photobacterium marinum]|uniref:Urease accessory protein UreD n=1 Tax=Photobacterium marinum TaxID=1056511 RepID=L8J9J8_9GAMM|nr:urease accessory protein UreD [Photobacterium marinum]ELR65471.1 Urease accessory protein UreD [Photobacterium marinum]